MTEKKKESEKKSHEERLEAIKREEREDGQKKMEKQLQNNMELV